jgi:hypothetical protein
MSIVNSLDVDDIHVRESGKTRPLLVEQILLRHAGAVKSLMFVPMVEW